MDVDGTLRDERMGIPPSAVWAVRQCSLRGIRMIVCTGRNPGALQEDVKALPFDGVISGGGCYIQYRGDVLLRRHFPEEITQKAIRMAADRSVAVSLEAEEKIYMDPGAASFYGDDIRRKVLGLGRRQREEFLARNKILYEENFGEYLSGSPAIHKICLIGQREQMDEVRQALNKEAEIVQEKDWGDRRYLELLPEGCHKGTAVEWLNRRLKISRENTMGFGDSENDIGLLKAVGLGVAVGAHEPIIKKYASSVCEPVMEDGIYRELVRRKVIDPILKEELA